MKISDRYPIVVTDHKVACRDFWQRHFGLDVLFDSDWFVLLGNEQQGSVVAFMSPDHPSAPPGPECFGGQGVCLEIEVDDIVQTHQHFTRGGGPADQGVVRATSLRVAGPVRFVGGCGRADCARGRLLGPIHADRGLACGGQQIVFDAEHMLIAHVELS